MAKNGVFSSINFKRLILSLSFLLIPSYVLADTASSVDQVLGALAEVVKDRAKEVATEAIIENLSNELCNGKPIDLPLENEIKRTLYLGNNGGCREKNNCNSDVLFVNSCRIIKDDSANVQLTDPYLLRFYWVPCGYMFNFPQKNKIAIL